MARTTFAAALKHAREAAGLSQAELARRAGLTGSYISVLESRRRRPPTPKVIRSLCKALGIPDEKLQEAAALERSPAAVRRRLERMRRERGKAQRTGDRLLTTTLFHLSRGPRVIDPLSQFMDLPPGQQAVLAGLLGRLRTARSVEEAEQKARDVLEETPEEDRDALVRRLPEVLAAAPPAGDAAAPPERRHVDVPRLEAPDAEDAVAERLSFDAALAEGDVFAWSATTSDAHPRIELDDLLLVRRDVEPADGDLVLFRHEDRWRLGIHHHQGREIRIAFPRPELPPLPIASADFVCAGVVTLIVRRP